MAEGRTTALDLFHSTMENKSVEALCNAIRYSAKQRAFNYEALKERLSGGAEGYEEGLFGPHLGDGGLVHLCRGLKELKDLPELNLYECSLTAASMPALSSALCYGVLELKVLILSKNLVMDEGMEFISQVIKRGHLKTLLISKCELTGSCCPSLSAALQSESCCLTDLDLSYNELGQSGALQICEGLKSPNCTVEILDMSQCGLTEVVFGELSRILRSDVSRILSLSLAFNQVGDAGVKHLWEALRHRNCKLQYLDLEDTLLTDACVEEMCESVAASSTLSYLTLNGNGMTDESAPRLVKLIQDSPQITELNVNNNNFSEDGFDLLDQCPFIRL